MTTSENVVAGAKNVQAALQSATQAASLAEEQALLDAEGAQDGNPLEPAHKPVAGLPEWAGLPPGFQAPPGFEVGFMRFRSGWTTAPHKGDRTIVVWSLTAKEEALALKRCGGDSSITLNELSKQMIRVIDGVPVNWNTGGREIELFWNEVGAKCRQLLINYYVKTHSLTGEETLDFFANCIAVRSVVLRSVSTDKPLIVLFGWNLNPWIIAISSKPHSGNTSTS